MLREGRASSNPRRVRSREDLCDYLIIAFADDDTPANGGRFFHAAQTFSHGLAAASSFTSSIIPLGGSSLMTSGLPVSSTLLTLDKIAGQPERPPDSNASGGSHE